MSPPIPRPPTLAAAVAAIGVTLALSACAGSQAAAGAGSSPASSPSAAASPSASPVATTSVSIVNFAFSPAVITVTAGSSVTWTNRDEDAHTVAITGTAPSTPLQNGDTYAHTFDEPGRYSYLCSIHPSMRGMVVVTAG